MSVRGILVLMTLFVSIELRGGDQLPNILIIGDALYQNLSRTIGTELKGEGTDAARGPRLRAQLDSGGRQGPRLLRGARPPRAHLRDAPDARARHRRDPVRPGRSQGGRQPQRQEIGSGL